MSIFWGDFGTVKVENYWQNFPVANNGGETFRLSLSCSDFSKLLLKGGILLRWQYDEAFGESYSTAKRIFISPDPIVINWPVPLDVESALGNILRHFQVKRWTRYSKYNLVEPVNLYARWEELFIT